MLKSFVNSLPPAPGMLTGDRDRHGGKWIPSLDGLRGLAVLLVIVAHCVMTGPTATQNGIVSMIFSSLKLGAYGVDLFFVLSGFLITGILLDTLAGPRYALNFYARRILRIFPLYFAFLATVFWVVFPLAARHAASLYQTSQAAWLVDHQRAYWLYYANWLPLTYGPHPGWAFVGHLWSLCIEEQFYLCWPAVVWLFGRRYTWLAACAALLGSVAARELFRREGWDAGIYASTVTHLDGISLGALAACVWRTEYRRALLGCAKAIVVGGAVLASLYLLMGWYNLVLPVSCLSLGLLLLALDEGSVWQKGLREKWLQKVGRVSYGMYVLHLPLTWLAKRGWSSWLGESALWQGIYIPAIVSVSFLIAQASWYGLEERCLRAKRYFVTANGKSAV